MSRPPCCCLLTGLAVSQLAARARRLKVITVTDAGYLGQIHETASLAKSATVPDVVVVGVRERASVGLLGLEGARFEYGSLLGHPPRLEPDGTVTVGRSRGMLSCQACPRTRSSCAPSATAGTTAAVFKAEPGSKPSLQARLVAVTLADQAGRAFSATHAARSVS